MRMMDDLKKFEDFIREMSHIPIYLRNVSEEEILQNPLFFHISKYPALQCIDVYKFKTCFISFYCYYKLT